MLQRKLSIAGDLLLSALKSRDHRSHCSGKQALTLYEGPLNWYLNTGLTSSVQNSAVSECLKGKKWTISTSGFNEVLSNPVGAAGVRDAHTHAHELVVQEIIAMVHVI